MAIIAESRLSDTPRETAPPPPVAPRRTLSSYSNPLVSSFAEAVRSFGVMSNLILPTTKFDSILSKLDAGTSFRIGKNDERAAKRKKKNDLDKIKQRRTDNNLWRGLISMFVAMTQLPIKFKYITKALESAGQTIAKGTEGAIQSGFLAVKDIALICWAIAMFISKYLVCIVQFFVTLPFCFISHIIWCIWKLFYTFLSFTSCMVWYATGSELMPMYDKAFDILGDADDKFIYPMLGFNLTKFPPKIIKLCYTCNNKVVRLSDVSKDTRPIDAAGKRFGRDMGVVAPRYMRPAKPHMYQFAVNMDKIFK